MRDMYHDLAATVLGLFLVAGAVLGSYWLTYLCDRFSSRNHHRTDMDRWNTDSRGDGSDIESWFSQDEDEE